MKKLQIIIFHVILFWVVSLSHVVGQKWNFIKEKDGVKLYSRQEAGNKLETFKGVAEFNTSSVKIFALLEDVNNRDWWDKNLEQIKLLKYEKNKRSQYYLVYKMPWPFNSRDMYVDIVTTINPSSGERKLTAMPMAGIQSEVKNMVRIKNYKQQWTVKPISENRTHIELEFYISPAEKFPEWLLNMILIDSPINSINGLRAQFKQ